MTNVTQRFTDLDEFKVDDIRNLRYGWPNSLWARQLRFHTLKNLIEPIDSTISNLTASLPGIISGASPLPTKPTILDVAPRVDIFVPDFFTSNGSACSSFTDNQGNVFTWYGPTPPIFTSIPQARNHNAKGLNFADASGVFVTTIPQFAYQGVAMYLGLSSHIPETGQSVVFEYSSYTGSANPVDKGIGFACKAGTLNHSATYSQSAYDYDRYYVYSGTDPYFSLIYYRPSGAHYWASFHDGVLSSLVSGVMTEFGTGALALSSLKYSNGKSYIPQTPVRYGYPLCYSPASALNSSALFHWYTLKTEPIDDTAHEYTYLQVKLNTLQPTKTCTSWSLPLDNGLSVDVSGFDTFGKLFIGDLASNGIYYLSGGVVPGNNTSRFRGILWFLTTFDCDQLWCFANGYVNPQLAAMQYYHSYFAFTNIEKWNTTNLCPSGCNGMFG